MFYRTSKEQGHYHVIFFDMGKGIALPTSETKKHRHMTMIAVAQQQEGVPGLPELSILPADDGHTHELGEIITAQERKSTQSEQEAHRMAVEIFKELKEYNAERIKKKKKALEYYRTEGQWSKGEKSSLDADERAHITANILKSQINSLAGTQIETRTDPWVVPIEGGDTRTADVANRLLKFVLENTDFSFKESLVFEDKAKGGDGIYHYYIDKDKNIEGDICVDRGNPEKTWLGPHNNFDLSDMEAYCVQEWVSKRKLMSLYPGKYSSVPPTQEESQANEDDFEHKAGTVVSYDETFDKEISVDKDFVDEIKHKYRIAEIYFKEFKKFKVLIPPEELDTVSTEGWDKKDEESAASIQGVDNVEKKGFDIRKIVLGGPKLMEDVYPKMDVNEFPIVVDYCDEAGEHSDGKITDGLEMQEMVNKQLSQTLDITSKMYNFMWFYFSETFGDDPMLEKAFKENSAKAGYACKVQNKDAMPIKVETHSFPQGLPLMVELAIKLLKEITLVNPEMQGIQSSANLSGRAIYQLKRSGLTGNMKLFDRSAYAKKTLCKRLIKLIFKTMEPERALRILNNEQLSEKVRSGEINIQEINNQNVEPQYGLEEIKVIFANADATKYDVQIAENPYNTTTREANYEMLSDLKKQGAMIPEEVLIDSSNLPYKGKIKQAIAQMQQMQAQQEQGKQQTEIVKTQIAANAKMQGKGAQPVQ